MDMGAVPRIKIVIYFCMTKTLFDVS